MASYTYGSVDYPGIMRKLERAYATAARIEVYRQKRIDQLAIESGIGRCGCRLHNYFVGCSNGKPWPEINNSKARELNRVWHDFRASRLVTAMYDRLVMAQATRIDA